MMNNTRTANTNIDDCIVLTYAMESTGHKGVVIRSVAQNHQFTTA